MARHVTHITRTLQLSPTECLWVSHQSYHFARSSLQLTSEMPLFTNNANNFLHPHYPHRRRRSYISDPLLRAMQLEQMVSDVDAALVDGWLLHRQGRDRDRSRQFARVIWTSVIGMQDPISGGSCNRIQFSLEMMRSRFLSISLSLCHIKLNVIEISIYRLYRPKYVACWRRECYNIVFNECRCIVSRTSKRWLY